MMISCTPVFGGAGVANQISELKRGTEVRVWLVLLLGWQLLHPVDYLLASRVCPR